MYLLGSNMLAARQLTMPVIVPCVCLSVLRLLSSLVQGSRQGDRQLPGTGPWGRAPGQGGQQGRRPPRSLPGEVQSGKQASGRYDDADEADGGQSQQRRRVGGRHCCIRPKHIALMVATLHLMLLENTVPHGMMVWLCHCGGHLTMRELSAWCIPQPVLANAPGAHRPLLPSGAKSKCPWASTKARGRHG